MRMSQKGAIEGSYHKTRRVCSDPKDNWGLVSLVLFQPHKGQP